MSEKEQKQTSQDQSSSVSKSRLKGSEKGRKEIELPIQYYAALMKHDAHSKVGGRIRQRRWSN